MGLRREPQQEWQKSIVMVQHPFGCTRSHCGFFLFARTKKSDQYPPLHQRRPTYVPRIKRSLPPLFSSTQSCIVQYPFGGVHIEQESLPVASKIDIRTLKSKRITVQWKMILTTNITCITNYRSTRFTYLLCAETIEWSALQYKKQSSTKEGILSENLWCQETAISIMLYKH